MGHPEGVVKAPEENEIRFLRLMAEHAEQLLVQLALGNPVVVVKPRLRPPADVEGGVDVGFGPLHDLAQFRPVVHLLKRHQFYRRAGDDQAVESPVPHLGERLVKGQHVGEGCVFGDMAPGRDQFQFNLQRGVAQNPGQLGFCVDFSGHQVQKEDLQRPDVLGEGPGFRHDEDILRREGGGGGQLVRYFDGHVR